MSVIEINSRRSLSEEMDASERLLLVEIGKFIDVFVDTGRPVTVDAIVEDFKSKHWAGHEVPPDDPDAQTMFALACDGLADAVREALKRRAKLEAAA